MGQPRLYDVMLRPKINKRNALAPAIALQLNNRLHRTTSRAIHNIIYLCTHELSPQFPLQIHTTSQQRFS
jgi:hypothetical protein